MQKIVLGATLPLPLKKSLRSTKLVFEAMLPLPLLLKESLCFTKLVLKTMLPLPLKKTLSLPLPLPLPLNKPHTQNLVGADGSKDADNTIAVAQEDAIKQQTQIVQQHKQTVQQQEAKKWQQEKESVAFAEDPKCLVAFWKEEQTPDWMRIATATAAKMAVANGNNEHHHAHKTAVSAQLQRIVARLSVRTAARIVIGNKRFGNFYMAAGGPAVKVRTCSGCGTADSLK